MILSAAFCDIYWTTKRRILMLGYMVFLMSMQGILYASLGSEIVRNIYPLIMHLPLAIALGILSKKCLWPLVSVLTTYLCCQLRRWIALCAVAVLQGDSMMQDMIELIITIPLLLAVMKFVAPSVRHISNYTFIEQLRFAVIPILGYGFDYITRVYTDWLNNGSPVVVEFMFFICSMVYLVSVIQSSKEEKKRSEMKQIQEYLKFQMTQSMREIETLRKSQEKASIYRHDLRHHMLYISSCIEKGNTNQALGYIQEVCSEIDASKVEIYSENEAVNLILSAFVTKARENGIAIDVSVALPSQIAITESDLCVLLSNALENALNACKKLKEKGKFSKIEVSGFEKNKKVFFEISNTCDDTVVFYKGIPITREAGHGIGIKSICAIVEKYEGIYTFLVKENRFILRVSL